MLITNQAGVKLDLEVSIMGGSFVKSGNIIIVFPIKFWN